MDEKEIRRYLRESFPRLAAGLERRFAGRASGEDAVQEAVVRAWQHTRGGAVIESWDGWLAVVATNAARMEVRRRLAEERAVTALASLRPGQGHRTATVAEAMEALPPRQRQILRLHYYEDLEVAQIARLLEISPGTVKSALHRGRRTLARLLRPYETTRSSVVIGWMLAGTHPQEYTFELTGDKHEGLPVASLRCAVDEPGGFGTAMQMFRPEKYQGRRMRVSAWLQARGVTDQMGLWMRVDGTEDQPLAFDNMSNRPITGTTGWVHAEVVLDVAPEATAVALGVLLTGGGEALVAGVSLEEVSPDVPVTGDYGRALAEGPRNLDFTEG
ncbi:RNA polymerase sigma factor [Planobispora longispora]|uniref:RNA polymerase sigma factor 70 region 4 type 2 domain-containing protein n=1 Tax=Planobispora longispora TaxID=28887 RepID=A0A8J3RML6_9ACTN|nr:RNA polymerase sigma factor [Planobispora longispora]GIH76866.1 hypothetical protein Plo01_32950 [Planobispora longispora]